MSSLLSQEEVDAIVSGKTGSEELSSESGSQAPIYVYDFKHPNRITKDHLRSLRMVHDNFTKLFANYLTNLLRTIVDVKLVSFDQATFLEFTMAMSEIDCIWIYNFNKLDGRGLLEVSPQLVFLVIDRLLGGKGEIYNENRPLTTIEQNVVRRITNRCVGLWNEALEKIMPVDAEITSFESNPQLAQIASLGETVLVIFLEVSLFKQTFPINFCVPYFVIEPLIQKVSEQNWINLSYQKSASGDKEKIAESIMLGDAELSVELGKTEITMHEFLNLQVGDVIEFEQKINKPINVKLGNKVRFLAKPGVVSMKKAIRIEKVLDLRGI